MRTRQSAKPNFCCITHVVASGSHLAAPYLSHDFFSAPAAAHRGPDRRARAAVAPLHERARCGLVCSSSRPAAVPHRSNCRPQVVVAPGAGASGLSPVAADA